MSGAAAMPGTVLIVDDMPDNVSLLHDALDAAGYEVLVALDGATAIRRAVQAQPDMVLLDARMPGMDGYAVARQLKADPDTAHIPIVFMTGLTDTEHVVAAYAAGGIDYVTKPIRPPEVLARVAAHMSSARQARQARNALDAHGHATLAVRDDASAGAPRVVWQTPLARRLLTAYFGPSPDERLPAPVADWLLADAANTTGASLPHTVDRPGSEEGTPASPGASNGAVVRRRLSLTLQQRTADGDRLIVLREVSDAQTLDVLVRAFALTLREAEVLYWVTKGKSNRDIGDILGTSPHTVKKQLEHVHAKLGVETRTAATARALGAWSGDGPG